MLVEFSVENFRSIRERVTLSMIAAKLRARDERLDRDNVIAVNKKISLLRSAVVYGANASGKSNLIKAARFMREFVGGSSLFQDEDAVQSEPFLLDTESATRPSTFEIVFLLDGLQYRYGFSLTAGQVVAEWLYFIPTLREVELFTRDEAGIRVGSRFREGRGLEGLNLDNTLFLSAVAQLKNGEAAGRVREWIRRGCRALTGVNYRGYLRNTVRCIEEDRYGEQLEALVRSLDLDILGLSVKRVPPDTNSTPASRIVAILSREDNGRPTAYATGPDATSDGSVKELRTSHAVRDNRGMVVEESDFPAAAMESQGTQKLIALAVPVLDALTNGRVLFLDEIDSRLHPLITLAILRLFNSPDTNRKNAQLICTTHDTNLLDRQLFRRDQIYFVEKDEMAASHLYSLAEFKLETPDAASRSIRNDASFEKDYIQGRYGAIPYLGDLTRLFSEEMQQRGQYESVDDSTEAGS